ncbi:hypothetical protein CS022_20350, partial [Veronia nyctiphanis]
CPGSFVSDQRSHNPTPNGPQNADGVTQIHAQARLLATREATTPPPMDMQELHTRFKQHASKEECYGLLSQLKFGYGECFQAIDGVSYGEGEALAKLVLPKRLEAGFDYYFLHPSLMDGATQSVISVVRNERTQGEELMPYVPFVASEIDIYSTLSPVCYAHLRLIRGPRDMDSMKKVDLTLLDEAGRVLVDMRGYTFKAFSFEEIAAAMSQQAVSQQTGSQQAHSQRSVTQSREPQSAVALHPQAISPASDAPIDRTKPEGTGTLEAQPSALQQALPATDTQQNVFFFSEWE